MSAAGIKSEKSSSNHDGCECVLTERVLPAKEKNDYYVSNRPPLAPNPLIDLKPSAVNPGGWLKCWLELERDGMVGQIDEVSPWVQPEGNAWLDPEGKQRAEQQTNRLRVSPWLQSVDNRWVGLQNKNKTWPYFRVPYWLRGYGDLGYVLKDEVLIRRAQVWREAVLLNQQADGYFGPASEKVQPDIFPHMVMLNCMESYYEESGDDRVIPFILRFFHFVDTLPEEKILTHEREWVAAVGGSLFQSALWTYNRTGESWLLRLADKIHRRTYEWSLGIYATLSADFGVGECPGAHCVNLAVGFREPAQYFQRTHDYELLHITETYWQDIRKTFGQFAGGMYASDERCRPGYVDPRQSIETCAIVEFMRSAELLAGITGNPVWADRCEDVAFNSFPAALMPDFRGLHYLTAANCVQLDHEDKRPAIQNDGCMFSFSPHDRYHCCQHNTGMGWPQFANHLWYASGGNGVAAIMYCESKVKVKVGDGTQVTIEERTTYPFSDTIRFKLITPKAVAFPWILRIPGWCGNASISINDEKVSIPSESGCFAIIRRTWNDGDRVELRLPMNLRLTRWEGNRNSISIHRGPLSYSLKIIERWEKYEGEKDNQGTEKWPEWQVFPDSPWNYALELNPKDLLGSFEVHVNSIPSEQPFTPENAPIEIRTKARRIPTWKMENGMVGLLPESPLKSSEPIETITMIPMGCARLRITSFPWWRSQIR